MKQFFDEILIIFVEKKNKKKKKKEKNVYISRKIYFFISLRICVSIKTVILLFFQTETIYLANS